MTRKYIKHDAVKKTLLKDKKILAEYEALSEEHELVRAMLKARTKAGMTQKAVADIMDTTASVVSRLESLHIDGHPSPSFDTLKKYAHAVGCHLSIKFIPDQFA